MVDQLLRYMRQGNLTGFPAISVPAGYDAAGLPVGVQFFARPYEERCVGKLSPGISCGAWHQRSATAATAGPTYRAIRQ